MGVILQQCFSGQERICCQERLHCHCAEAGLCAQAPGAQQAQLPRAGLGQTLLSEPRAALAPTGLTGVAAGQLCSSNRHISALIHKGWAGLAQCWAPTHHHSIAIRGWERCHWGHHLPALCACFNLNWSVTPPHLVKRDVTSRLPWCTQDTCWGFLTPRRGWEECPHSRTPQSQCFSNLCHATLLFQNTLGSKKPAGFPESSVNCSLFWTLLFCSDFWRCNCQMKGTSGWPGLPSGHQSLLPSLGTDTAGCTRAHKILWNSNLFSVQRETPNNHIKKPHLLIPGGPSKCLSGFLKVLGSEGPTWVSSALSLPVCDWRNRWAEPLCHWIMDLSFYSCISRWPVDPYSTRVFWVQPHTRTLLELLGAAHRATTH